MKHILKCGECGRYTMKELCPECREETKTTKPARFSPIDKWGFYRRKAKKERGII